MNLCPSYLSQGTLVQDYIQSQPKKNFVNQRFAQMEVKYQAKPHLFDEQRHISIYSNFEMPSELPKGRVSLSTLCKKLFSRIH